MGAGAGSSVTASGAASLAVSIFLSLGEVLARSVVLRPEAGGLGGMGVTLWSCLEVHTPGWGFDLRAAGKRKSGPECGGENPDSPAERLWPGKPPNGSGCFLAAPAPFVERGLKWVMSQIELVAFGRA